MSIDYESIDFCLTLEDGILYCEFRNKSTINVVIEAEKAAIELLIANNLKPAPFIISMKDIDQSKTDINMKNLSKVITSNNILDYISCMWVIGAKKQIKILASLLNKTFFEGKINFAQTIEEAHREAINCRNKKSTILDFNA